ncbi:hypothetical protein [Castellaniella sp.]|uniref:hypothetical protein n=1 Tax=Castellaniella sp. TaxID=1955812 RepID=UPI00355E813D
MMPLENQPMLWIARSIRWTMMLCVTALIAGCAAIPAGSYCDLANPIWWQSVDELDATPDGIVRQVVRHNERYEAVCGMAISRLG